MADINLQPPLSPSDWLRLLPVRLTRPCPGQESASWKNYFAEALRLNPSQLFPVDEDDKEPCNIVCFGCG